LSFMARILKGPFAAYLDQERGSALHGTAVLFLKSCSIEKGDLPDRLAIVAEQIWRSEKVFRNADGSVNIALRVRSRLSASPLYDSFRWWKNEFVDHQLYTGYSVDTENLVPPNNSDELAVTLEPSSIQNGVAPQLPTAPDLLLNNELWGDLGLDLTDDWGFSATNMAWMA